MAHLPSLLFAKLGPDALLPALRNPPPSSRLLTFSDLHQKSETFAGAMRKFGVGAQLVANKPARIGVWGGEWAPCEFAISVLGIMRAGGVPVLLPPGPPTGPLPAVSLLIAHSTLLEHIPSSFPTTNVIILDLDSENNETGYVDVTECCESRTYTRWHSDGNDEDDSKVEKGDGYVILSGWGEEKAVPTGEIVKGLAEWKERVKGDARLTNAAAFSVGLSFVSLHSRHS